MLQSGIGLCTPVQYNIIKLQGRNQNMAIKMECWGMKKWHTLPLEGTYDHLGLNKFCLHTDKSIFWILYKYQVALRNTSTPWINTVLLNNDTNNDRLTPQRLRLSPSYVHPHLRASPQASVPCQHNTAQHTVLCE